MRPSTPLIPLALLALLLAGCQSTDIPLTSEVSLPAAFEQAEAGSSPTELAQWWRQWNDPVLSGLIEQALQHSHDIRIAESRLREAEAFSRLAAADLGPSAGLGAELSRLDAHINNPLGEQERAALSHIPAAAAVNQEQFRLKGNSLSPSLSASWAPDIFGQKRSDADAARQTALGVQAQLYGARLLLAGSVAEHYLQARAVQVRQADAERSVATLGRLKNYVDGRFRAGQVNAYAVNEVAARLSAAQARLDTLAAEYTAHVRALAVLSGQTPQGYRLPDSPRRLLAEAPAAPVGHTPAGLLERRPDLRAHAAQVQAQAARLASAKADLLPRFSIEFLGQGSINIDSSITDLTAWGSLLRIGIKVPLFTNGRAQANIDAADARLNTALLQYDQTLLQALADVDNAYHSHRALSRQNTLLAQAHTQAERQARAAESLFRHGQQTLDQVLSAQLNEQAARDTLTQSQLAQNQTLIRLYQALGGGWEAVAGQNRAE